MSTKKIITDDRPDNDVVWMRIASVVSSRATCPRKKVGAVIVRDNGIVTTGYNGSLPDQPHCTEVGCMMVNDHCERTVHSEANAILQATHDGRDVKGGTIYVTASPCFYCFKLIVRARIKRIVFGELYRDERIREFSAQCGIELVDMTLPTQCGDDDCSECTLDRIGCGCDGSFDDGCYRCTPSRHTRPACPPELLAKTLARSNWRMPV